MARPAGRELVSAERAAARRRDPDPGASDGTALRREFAAEGYAVVRDLIPAELCDRARAAFAAEVKPYAGQLYRQTSSGSPERHVFSDHGYLLNPILNIQSLRQTRFPRFRAAGLEILTDPGLHQAAKAILGEPGKVVQSMYFEGNSATWAHQDAYYLDSAGPGGLIGAWIALEDIAPGAGRFYIYPQSHRIDLAGNRGELDIAFHHDRYKQHVREVIAAHGLRPRAPALRRGDVLFWSAKTIHGSLETTEPQHSRSSITAHLLAASSEFLQFQRRRRRLPLVPINGIQVHLPKNQNAWRPRAALWAEATFPTAFRLAKRAVIKMVVG
jgi:phytanoyl-CoA hydroxylase